MHTITAVDNVCLTLLLLHVPSLTAVTQLTLGITSDLSVERHTAVNHVDFVPGDKP